MSGFRRQQSKLPVILAVSVGVFGVLTIAIALASMKKGSVPAQADVDKRDRVVVVEKEAPIEMVDVLVPMQEIETGKKLEPAMFKLEKSPKVAVNASSIRSF